MSFMEKRRVQLERHQLAGEIAFHLQAFEADLNRALSSGSRLIGFLPEARTRAKVSDAIGHDAISSFIDSLGFIDQALGRVTSGHLRLDHIRRELRIPEAAGGDKIPLPSVTGSRGDQAPSPHAISG